MQDIKKFEQEVKNMAGQDAEAVGYNALKMFYLKQLNACMEEEKELQKREEKLKLKKAMVETLGNLMGGSAEK